MISNPYSQLFEVTINNLDDINKWLSNCLNFGIREILIEDSVDGDYYYDPDEFIEHMLELYVHTPAELNISKEESLFIIQSALGLTRNQINAIDFWFNPSTDVSILESFEGGAYGFKELWALYIQNYLLEQPEYIKLKKLLEVAKDEIYYNYSITSENNILGYKRKGSENFIRFTKKMIAKSSFTSFLPIEITDQIVSHIA